MSEGTINTNTNEIDKTTYFKIEIEKKANGKKFTLVPDLIRNTKGQEGLSANPDAEHYWNKDIFSYITYAEVMNKESDTAQFKLHSMAPGDTIYYSNGLMVLEKVTPNPVNEKYQFKPTDTAIMAELNVYSTDGKQFKANPVFYVEDNVVKYHMDTVFAEGLAIGLSQIVDNKHLGIIVKESSQLTPFIALKVLQFPFINILWLGTILMVTGFVMSMVRRAKLVKRERVVQ